MPGLAPQEIAHAEPGTGPFGRSLEVPPRRRPHDGSSSAAASRISPVSMPVTTAHQRVSSFQFLTLVHYSHADVSMHLGEIS